MSAIDTSKNTLVNTIKVDHKPMKIAISPDGHRAYALNSVSDSVSALDINTI